MNKDCKLINKEELLKLVKQVYEQACFGHYDLLESYCEKEVDSFYEKLPSGKIHESITKLDLTPRMPSFGQYLITPELATNFSNVTITNNTTDLL